MVDSELIVEVRKVELEILDEIHRVCTENNLKYSIAYGTLLGAVRHGGFIPWDDDIDVMMPREDFEKLVSIWNEKSLPGFILQTTDTSKDYTNNFAKICKDNTTFLQFEEHLGKDFHKGIYVDIFPGDRLADTELNRKKQFAACAINLLMSRRYTSGSGGITEFAERLILSLTKRNYRKIQSVTEEYFKKWNRCNTQKYIFPCTIRSCKKYYPSDMFDNLSLIKFEDKEYLAFEKFDEILRIAYGDYMELPPEEERVWKHHPLLIDFEHNFEDIESYKESLL